MLSNRPAFAAHYALVGSLGLLASSVALANEETIRLSDTVVTASGFEQKITEAPASISVISQEDLQQNRYSNLAQVLENVEGIDTNQSTGKTGGLNISIRGMESQHTLILIDGRRQNAPGNIAPNGFGETSTSFIPPMSAIERIEVIRGPMSTLYGSDALGGVVNIITKKVGDEWSGTVSLDHTFQENRDYGDASKTSFYTSGPLVDGLLGLAVRGSLYNREESDLMFDNDSEVSKRGASPVEGRNYTIGGRLNLTPVANHDFYLDFERGRQVYENDECQLGTLDGRDRNCQGNPGTANGYSDQLRFEREQYALGHNAHLSFGNLNSSVTHSTTETLGRTIPGDIGVPYAGFPSIIGGNDRELETTDLILDSKLVAPLGEANLFTIGGQYRDSEMTDGIAGEYFEQDSWALFAENEWRMRHDLALTLGGRYEDHEAFGGHFTPRAYLVWNTNDNWTLKGGVSKGYRTPDLNDLHDGINGITGQGTTITIGSPDLDPEESTNTEFGVYYDNLTGFNANATVFHNKFKDKISDGNDITVTGHPTISDGDYSQLTNIGKAETQGLELAASWMFAPRWTLSGNYTYSDSEQKSGPDKGERLNNTPEHLLNAKLNWHATERLSMWLRGEYRGERTRFTQRYANLNADDQAIERQVGDMDAYELFHLGGAYRASDNVTLTATIYNLFDKDFLEGTTYVDSAGDTQWSSNYAHITRGTSGTIQEGRRLWLSATVDF
ncbi:outer membrane receptor for ferrienterochelin and colicins [Halopseudomonas litoralis]|uniref:Outer membrane receptor for ferrienterochelin and colicins n=1 Tax=Halopseudomonas litoralis TaxID=797277 RepID=A0A1H1R876_9GAMM|nr:TonB-dependent receptor [Halopseudomonas litoralis]SDS31982.1 outer membrane receptor for ferrienterochelin and colicins [Halopseudomonas litoralis]